MADSLKFHRPVSANIGNYEIICSLSHSSLIEEKDEVFLTPPRTSYKDNCQDNENGIAFFSSESRLFQRNLFKNFERKFLKLKIPNQSSQLLRQGNFRCVFK